MIILVMSDTHRDLKNAILAIKQTKNISMLIHCGDHIEDARRLQEMFPEITFNYVPGNCDGWFFKAEEKTKVISVKDKRILFTHGDTYSINFSYDELFEATREKGAMVGLCGHSHVSHVEIEEETGISVVNPGSIALPRDSKYPSYAVLEVNKGEEIGIEMMIIKDGKTMRNPLFK